MSGCPQRRVVAQPADIARFVAFVAFPDRKNATRARTLLRPGTPRNLRAQREGVCMFLEISLQKNATPQNPRQFKGSGLFEHLCSVCIAKFRVSVHAHAHTHTHTHIHYLGKICYKRYTGRFGCFCPVVATKKSVAFLKPETLQTLCQRQWNGRYCRVTTGILRV